MAQVFFAFQENILELTQLSCMEVNVWVSFDLPYWNTHEFNLCGIITYN